MAVTLETATDVDVWMFVKSLVTLSLVSSSHYARNRALMLIDMEASPYIDPNTQRLVTMFIKLGLHEDDLDIKTWHAERVGILLDIDVARIPHAPGKRPDFPERLEEYHL